MRDRTGALTENERKALEEGIRAASIAPAGAGAIASAQPTLPDDDEAGDLVEDLQRVSSSGSSSGSRHSASASGDDGAGAASAGSTGSGLGGSAAGAAGGSAGAGGNGGGGGGHGYVAGVEPRKVKLLLLGDSGVGKSSLILRWYSASFSTSLTGTVGVDFKSKRLDVDGEEVAVQVWDTAGQERFRKITRAFYRGSHVVVLVYDVTSEESFANISYWMRSIKDHASSSASVVLVGNKTDSRAAQDGGISPAAGQQAADSCSAPFFETSARTGEGVDRLFDEAILLAVRTSRRGSTSYASSALSSSTAPAATVSAAAAAPAAAPATAVTAISAASPVAVAAASPSTSGRSTKGRSSSTDDAESSGKRVRCVVS